MASGNGSVSWMYLENSLVEAAIKKAGFNGYLTNEGQQDNFAVFSPNQIKSTTGNVGTFSEDDSILKAAATSVDESFLDASDFDKSGNVKPEVLKEIAAEQARIEKEAKASGTWLKAPNGKDTNLNKHQWITVRTKRFKKWFGDWDLMQKKTDVINAARHDFTNLNEAGDWAKQNIVGTYRNKDTGESVRVSNRSISEFLARPTVAKSSSQGYHLATLRVIPRLLENAVLTEEHADRKGRADFQIQRFYAAVNIKGNLRRVKLTVRAFHEGSSKSYSYEVAKIEETVDGSLRSQRTPEPHTAQSSVSIATLLQGSKKNNGERWDVTYSKVVDKNGEPLVVYHGTNADFDAFDRRKAGRTGGGAFFFSSNSDFAQGFGSGDSRRSLMPAFLSSVLIFDPSNAEHINKVRAALEAVTAAEEKKPIHKRRGLPLYHNLQGTLRAIADRARGTSWMYLENPLVEAAIKKAGFNGYLTNEGQQDNFAVFSPNQIKSATGNTGTFSEDDSILKSAVSANEGFYSQLERVIEQKMPNKASAEQIKGILSPNNGVKQEELDWIDLDSFLAASSDAEAAASIKLTTKVFVRFTANLARDVWDAWK